MNMTHSHGETVLYIGIELSSKTWLLCFYEGRRIRSRGIPAGDLSRFFSEVDATLKKFNLPADTLVRSCYEAGRDGFWIHRMLRENDIYNIVVDSSSLEVKRGRKNRKTDKIDAQKLVKMLYRYYVLNEEKIWSVCRVPSKEAENERRLGREYSRLKKESNGHICRIRALLKLEGIEVKNVLKVDFSQLTSCTGKHLSPQLVDELSRQKERLELVERHKKDIQKIRLSRLKNPQTKGDEIAAKLYQVKGVGEITAWNLSKEFFAWRNFKNRRQLGGFIGLADVPYDSGDSRKPQGISKCGNTDIRNLMIQISWRWIYFQPDCDLTKWYFRRFSPDPEKETAKTMRKIGIVAVARKLTILLWRYLETDELPEGVELKSQNIARCEEEPGNVGWV